MMTVQIGLIGDYSPEVVAHSAIPKALALAANETASDIDVTWLATATIARHRERLASVDALWCVPGSPYASLEGALLAIQFAREQDCPFLGTCGGFQHALIEYTRNVLGYAAADHAESHPSATMPLITPLSCSLVGVQGSIKLKADTQIRRIYGTEEVVEQYHCSFGLNPRYQSLLESGALEVTGRDAEGQPRVVELAGHPFFIATLFQPERSASSGRVHPLLRAYVRAAASSAR
jgi:CTP synthase (UTP-ammonia lyase)